VSGLLLLAVATAGHAQTLDCEALANSPFAEPDGYAEQCLGAAVPAPATGGGVLAPTDPSVAFNMRTAAPTSGRGFYNHTLNNMTGATIFGGDPGFSVFAMDFDTAANTLYATDNTAVPPRLLTVNLTTGATTFIANVSGLAAMDAITDLTINPTTGAAFMTAFGAAANSNLYSFNLTTATATLIGSMGTGGIMIDAAVNCAGQMFGHSISTDSLYSINTATGAATLIGPHGLAANFAQGMDFDSNDGQLYAWIYTGAGTYTYGTFNLATGAITPISTNTPPGEWEGATRTTCTPPDADVAIAKTAQVSGPLSVGSNFTYTLTATNNGPASASNVVVSDTLPPQVTYVSNNCGATAVGNAVTWTIGTLANAASQSCVITVQVAQTGAISNTATITTTSNDPVPANNSATNTLAGAPADADVSIAKTAQTAGPLSIGSTFTYTLTATNNGPATATGVVVNDNLPPQVAYVSNNCGATAAGNAVTWTIGTLANGASQSCVITVQVTQSGAISNTATIAATSNDPVPGNNSAIAGLGGVSVSVPTLSPWALLALLAGLLGLGAVWVARRPA
jgi:uncharacterized repeat protein (TIGR01451 family)